MRLLQSPPFVHLADPDDVREMFTAPPEVLHPGEGAKVLEPVIGANSVILLDEGAHLSQRKLMLPAFHGEKMQRLSGLMQEVTEEEVARWPRDEPVALHPRLQALTLEVILRAVFGLEAGERLDALRDRLTRILEFGSKPSSLIPALQRGRTWREFERRRGDADAADLRDDRRAPRRAQRRRRQLRRRRAGDAAGGPPRGRLADVARRAARRADDAARGGPRDDRLGARLGVRAAGADARRDRPARRGDRLRRRRRLPDRDGAGDAPPPPGDPERGAAADDGAGRDRRLDAIRRACACSRTRT